MSAKITGRGDGSAPTVALTFPFLEKDHVKAAIDGAPVSLIWTGTSQVRLAVDVPSGSEWVVYRSTPTSPALVEFADASPFTAGDLNTSDTSHRYRDEELDDADAQAVRAPSGETLDPLPPAPMRANTVLVFDGAGRSSVSPVALAVTAAPGAAVLNRVALSAIVMPVPNQAALLLEPGRSGWFLWDPGNRSASVAADLYEGLYVPPSEDPSGASGAWVRLQENPDIYSVTWFGVSGTNSEASNTAILDSIFDQALPGSIELVFPNALIPASIIIPPQNTTFISTVTIRGETGPATWFGTISGPGYTMSNLGAIVVSTASIASFDQGGVIFAAPNSGGFSNVKLVVKSITLRTYDDPNQNGLNAWFAQQLVVEDVQIDTGVWTTDVSLPSHNERFGLLTPAANNGAFTSLENVAITGYRRGLGINEHTVGNNLSISGCYQALQFFNAAHSSKFGRVIVQRCQRGIYGTGTHHFVIDELNIEHANPDTTTSNGGIDTPGDPAVGNGWQVTVWDIEDPSNYLVGEIATHAVKGGVGLDPDPLLVNGGEGIFFRKVGLSNVGFLFASAAGTSLPNGVETFVPFTGTLATSGMAQDAADNTSIVVSVPGLYRLSFDGSMVPGATGRYIAAIYVNGEVVSRQELTAPEAGGLASLHVGRAAYPLVAGDVLRVSVMQTSGGDLTLTQNSYSGGLTTERIAAAFG